MECEGPEAEYGRAKYPVLAVGVRAAERLERQLSGGDAGGLRLDARGDQVLGGLQLPKPADPFMNIMDEISFWVYTKQAPCLMNFDNVIKRQYEATHASRALASTNDRSNSELVPSPKKKKRKLSMLDDECMSQKQQNNIYFKASQGHERTGPSSCKSNTLESDIDFNIKNSSIQGKQKRIKVQRSGRTLHKKNKVVTSTPVRRSLRRTQNGTSTSQLLNFSFDSYNSNNVNGITDQSNSKPEVKSGRRPKRSLGKALRRDTNTEGNTETAPPTQSKGELVTNGQFEDLSDVSGFTANYIRSTKLHSNTKSSKTLRNKGSRHLVKESRQAPPKKDTTMLVCVNKSVNATVQQPQPSFLNCSTDSSQNVINLVTTPASNQQVKVNKSTSLLKFINVKTTSPKENATSQLHSSKECFKTDLHISLPPKKATISRYPRRHKPHFPEDISDTDVDETQTSLDKRKKRNKDIDFNNCDHKELPISRTRSGKSKSQLHRPVSPLIVTSITSIQPSSSAGALNVASHNPPRKSKSQRVSSNKFAPLALVKRSMDRSDGVIRRDSVREQSGFAACFSDSDDGSEALKQRKFFC